jgi:transposase
MTDSSGQQQALADLRAAVGVQVRAAYAIGPGAVVSVVLALLAQYEAAVTAELAALEARIAALETRAAAARKDSHNSGKPPSSDVTRAGRAPRSLRGKSGKPSGGQPGHPGRTLALRAEPDVVHVHAPAACPACAAPFAPDAAPAPVPGERRQVFELPPLTLVCTEHRVAERTCARCGATSRGAYPPEARSPAQYGPGVLALGVALTAQHLLPVQRAADVVSALIGHAISPATLLAAERRAADAVAPAVAEIRAGLARAPVVGFDETGFFVGRARWWLHVACTRALAYYTAHPRRGAGAHDAIGLLPTFTAGAHTALHDAYASYFTYRGCRHALCGVHIARELLFLEEEGGAATAAWAGPLRRALDAMRRAAARARAAGRAALDARTRRGYGRRFDALLARGLAAEPPPARGPRPAKPRRSPGGQLLERLRKYRGAVLRFVEDLAVPFDNSEAERDLRMMKVEQKVSGGFRTAAGAHTFCALRSYLVTARKQGVAPLDALHMALVGLPFMPAVP